MAMSIAIELRIFLAYTEYTPAACMPAYSHTSIALSPLSTKFLRTAIMSLIDHFGS